MPLDPQRVQAIFLEAACRLDLADRGAVLDRECGDDIELRQRIEAFLKAHNRFNDFANEPLGGPDDTVAVLRTSTRTRSTVLKLKKN
jgi:hypothetical protein